MYRRLLLAALGGLGITLGTGVATASAAATKVVSENWSGYAVTRTTSSNNFERVAGSWTQPAGTCTAGETTYSSVWVGLGGFEEASKALEQTGSEVDCTASGQAVYAAWYELVPANPVHLDLAIEAGDRLSASVAVKNGKNGKVILQVKNLTTGRSKTVVRKMSGPAPNRTSAEWIVEAPTACTSSSVCRTLPLTDFGTVSFSKTSATTAQGTRTSIDASGYRVTELELHDLAAFGQRFSPGETSAFAGAIPTALTGGGDGFSVTWQRLEDQQDEAGAPPSFPGGRPTQPQAGVLNYLSPNSWA